MPGQKKGVEVPVRGLQKGPEGKRDRLEGGIQVEVFYTQLPGIEKNRGDRGYGSLKADTEENDALSRAAVRLKSDETTRLKSDGTT